MASPFGRPSGLVHPVLGSLFDQTMMASKVNSLIPGPLSSVKAEAEPGDWDIVLTDETAKFALVILSVLCVSTCPVSCMLRDVASE